MSRKSSPRGSDLTLAGATLALAFLAVASAGASGRHVVRVGPPNGVDDTEAIQTALNQCVDARGPCVVRLRAGTYRTRQLVTYNFRGTFRGVRRDLSIIEALPNLHVDFCDEFDPACDVRPAHPTDYLWPNLITFSDGDITISDLTVKATAKPATQPWPFMGETHQVLMQGIQIQGQYRTRASLERLDIVGARDAETGWFGFNLINGANFLGLVPKPGQPFQGFYPLSGDYSVRSCSFTSMVAGAVAGGWNEVIQDSRIVIGGAPFSGITTHDVLAGIDIENVESSAVTVSHNVVDVPADGWDAVDVLALQAIPTQPSTYNIHHNTLTISGGDGVQLVDNFDDNKVIRALIHDNVIHAQGASFASVDAIATSGSMVWGNRIEGSGHAGVMMQGASECAILANSVRAFTPAADAARIVLDAGTTQCFVAGRYEEGDILDLGQDNHIVTLGR